jgi:hypothetical protein
LDRVWKRRIMCAAEMVRKVLLLEGSTWAK